MLCNLAEVLIAGSGLPSTPLAQNKPGSTGNRDPPGEQGSSIPEWIQNNAFIL